MYVYLDQGIRKVAVLPRVCPLYEKVQGMAIGGPSSLGAAVKASDQRYLAVAFEHEENLVEVAQDGAVLSPFALAQLSQSLTPVYVHDVTPWATARDHELARDATTKEGDVPSSGARRGVGNEEDVPRSGNSKDALVTTNLMDSLFLRRTTFF